MRLAHMVIYLSTTFPNGHTHPAHVQPALRTPNMVTPLTPLDNHPTPRTLFDVRSSTNLPRPELFIALPRLHDGKTGGREIGAVQPVVVLRVAARTDADKAGRALQNRSWGSGMSIDLLAVGCRAVSELGGSSVDVSLKGHLNKCFELSRSQHSLSRVYRHGRGALGLVANAVNRKRPVVEH